MGDQVQIVEQEYVRIDRVKSFIIQIMNVELNKSVNFMVSILNRYGLQIDVKSITLEGDEYRAWGNDDTYLYKIVAERFGFTLE